MKQAAAEVEMARPQGEPLAARGWDFDRLSWLAPRVPLRQVICILGAGQDAVAEECRLLYTRLQNLRQMRPLRTILITSALQQEGKSFVALNLAAALCQRGRNKVLLVEADLRWPSYCSALGIDAVAGMADYCEGSEDLANFVYRVSGTDWCLLPAGKAAAQPREALGSSRMSQALAQAREVFDWVLVDSPPLVPAADSALLSHLCDGVLLVIRRHRAEKSALAEALRRIEPAKLLGLVLNGFPRHPGCQAYFKNTAEPASQSPLSIIDYRKAA